MAVEIPGFSSSFKAGEDLSSKQYHFVKLNSSNEVVACAAATDNPCGILQNSPASGQEALVMHMGISKVVADAALTVGTFVGTSADGQADAKVHGTDTTEYIVGQVTVGTNNAGEKASVLFNCLGIGRAA